MYDIIAVFAGVDNTCHGNISNCSTPSSNFIFFLSIDLYGDMYGSYDFYKVRR